MAIEHNLAVKKCIADAMFLSGSWAFSCYCYYWIIIINNNNTSTFVECHSAVASEALAE